MRETHVSDHEAYQEDGYPDEEWATRERPEEDDDAVAVDLNDGHVHRPVKPQMSLPIGEVDTGELAMGEVGYSRQITVGPDRNDTAWVSCKIPVPFQIRWDIDQVAAQAAAYGNIPVAVVCQQAGLPVTEDGGVLREAVRRALPGAEEVPVRRARNERAAFPSPADMEMPERVNRDDWDDLVANPDDWWDNRAEKAGGKGNPRGPDFRHKRDGTGIWVTPYKPPAGASSGRGRGRGYDR